MQNIHYEEKALTQGRNHGLMLVFTFLLGPNPSRHKTW